MFLWLKELAVYCCISTDASHSYLRSAKTPTPDVTQLFTCRRIQGLAAVVMVSVQRHSIQVASAKKSTADDMTYLYFLSLVFIFSVNSLMCPIFFQNFVFLFKLTLVSVAFDQEPWSIFSVYICVCVCVCVYVYLCSAVLSHSVMSDFLQSHGL